MSSKRLTVDVIKNNASIQVERIVIVSNTLVFTESKYS